jgi:hypothetical protein
MATLTIFNVCGTPLHLGDFYTSVAPNKHLVVKRPVKTFSTLVSLHKAAKEEKVAVGISYDVGEVPLKDPFAPAERVIPRKSWEVKST